MEKLEDERKAKEEEERKIQEQKAKEEAEAKEKAAAAKAARVKKLAEEVAEAARLKRQALAAQQEVSVVLRYYMLSLSFEIVAGGADGPARETQGCCGCRQRRTSEPARGLEGHTRAQHLYPEC